MANVNLISARRQERVRLARVARGLATALFVVGGLGFGLVAFQAGQFLVAKARVAQADAELERLRPVLAQIEAEERERAVLQPKLVTLSEAQKRTNTWFGITEGLKRAVPDQTWLTNISVERAGEGPQVVRMNGMTINQTRVGETIYRLGEQREHYERVDLSYTQTTRVDEIDRVEFELRARLNQPEAEKKEQANASEG